MATLLVARSTGQLANLLFQYSHVVALAADGGFTAAFPGFGPDAEHFPALAGDAACRWPAPPRPLPPRLRPLLAKAVAAGLRLPGAPSIVVPDGEERNLVASDVERRVVLLAGWGLRAPEAFARHRDTIREVFTPAERHVRAAEEAVARARGDARVLVGVHRRVGDYADWHGGRYLFSDEQYRAVMDRVEEAVGPDVAFMVCSNAPWDEDVVRASPGPGAPIDDLHALSLCDFVIGPPSTFSMWASFMGAVPRYEIQDADAPISAESFAPYVSG